jgi:L-amino acid N-acyltransferase YncA
MSRFIFSDNFKGLDVGYYELNPFPGCNQLVVSNHATIFKAFRNKGYGARAALHRINMAESLGYDAMIATVKDSNTPQKIIMDRMGWSNVFSFENSETDNLIHVYMKNLNVD